MLRVLFLINPRAGRGAALKTWRRVERLATGGGWFDWIVPGDCTETKRAAAEAARAGVERVVVIGGDGTLDAVAGELAHTDTALGIIPSGTGNDFCHTAGIPTDLEAAFAIAVGPVTKRIDLGIAGGRHRFLNVAGAGFDAEVGACSSRVPSRLGGGLTYLVGTLSALAHSQPVAAEIQVDEQCYSGQTTMVAVANGPQYGGGMRIAPDARRDDGLLDVCVVEGMSRTELLRIFPGVYAGQHVKHPKIRMLRGREVQIRPQAPMRLHADGDVLGLTEFTFRVEPGALAVAMP